jgi:hypothetical protein
MVLKYNVIRGKHYPIAWRYIPEVSGLHILRVFESRVLRRIF